MFKRKSKTTSKPMSGTPTIPIYILSTAQLAHHSLSQGIASQMVNGANASFDDIVNNLGGFNEDDEVSEEELDTVTNVIMDSLVYMGASKEIMDDILSEDEDISIEALNEFGEIIMDSMGDMEVEALGYALHTREDGAIMDWGIVSKKEGKAYKRVPSEVEGGRQMCLRPQKVNGKEMLARVPVEICEHPINYKNYKKSSRTTGKSSPTRTTHKTPEYAGKARKSALKRLKKAKEGKSGGARADSFLLTADAVADLTNEQREEYKAKLDSFLNGDFEREPLYPDLDPLEMMDDNFEELDKEEQIEYLEILDDIVNDFNDCEDNGLFEDSSTKRPKGKVKRSDCNKKQEFKKVWDSKAKKYIMGCRVKEEYEGKINPKAGKRRRGKHRSQSSIDKQIATMARNN